MMLKEEYLNMSDSEYYAEVEKRFNDLVEISQGMNYQVIELLVKELDHRNDVVIVFKSEYKENKDYKKKVNKQLKGIS